MLVVFLLRFLEATANKLVQKSYHGRYSCKGCSGTASWSVYLKILAGIGGDCLERAGGGKYSAPIILCLLMIDQLARYVNSGLITVYFEH